jgi:hypothetical protein
MASSRGTLVDNFSVRFTRTVTFTGGTYRFTVLTDDGSRLWVATGPSPMSIRTGGICF